MRNFFFFTVLVSFLMFSCGNRSQPEQGENLHTHSDCADHSHSLDHDHDPIPHDQESFIAEGEVPDQRHGHDHGEDSDHKHDHGHNHTRDDNSCNDHKH